MTLEPYQVRLAATSAMVADAGWLDDYLHARFQLGMREAAFGLSWRERIIGRRRFVSTRGVVLLDPVGWRAAILDRRARAVRRVREQVTLADLRRRIARAIYPPGEWS